MFFVVAVLLILLVVRVSELASRVTAFDVALNDLYDTVDVQH